MKCRVCSGSRVEVFLDLGDQPHCDSLLREEELLWPEPTYPLQPCFCHDCATVQINYTVPKETMFSEYLYVSGTTQTLRAHFQASADRSVAQLGLRPGNLVVDIGSNDGTWLACYQGHRLCTLGVESASNLAAAAKTRGVTTLNRFFNAGVAREIVRDHGRAKLVTAAGVFFHLEELHSVTEGISELIAEGGTFCLQVIYLGDVLRNTQFDNFYHEHLTLWSLTALERLFELHDLQVISVAHLPIHGGSLELLVTRRGDRTPDASVADLRAEERQRGFHEFQTYADFATRVGEIGNELLAIMRGYRVEGKTVYAFGAPAKGATLLNYLKLTAHEIPYAVEVNPLKIGKYIPGARIPIVDERSTPEPDAYLMLPWNFLPEFLRTKRDYIQRGGAFIVPIPRPLIIDRHNYVAHVTAGE